MHSSKAIIICSHLPILATVVIATLRYSKASKSLKAFCWFIFLSGAVQFTSLAFWFTDKNNMPLLHFYVAAGFVSLVWFYKTVLGNFIDARVMWSIIILFLAFTLTNSLFIQNVFTFNSYALVVESILVITLAIFTFIFFLNSATIEAGIPDIKSLTWINSGLFVYYLSCLLIFYFGEIIIRELSLELNRLTWVIHSFFSVVMYTCFFIGLWKTSKDNY